MSVAGRVPDQAQPAAREGAPLVVFDFDHTLYDGDSFGHAVKWLIKRAWWRRLLALLIVPVCLPMIAFRFSRRRGIGAFVWVGTIGFHRRRDLDELIDRYVGRHADAIKARLLPAGLAVLHRHREAGDNVVIATGAPPELARAILAFVAHEDVPVVGTTVGPRFGAVVARRHCHHRRKLTMLHEAGFGGEIAVAYSDSLNDLPLLKAAAKAVVVNPKASTIDDFRQQLPANTLMLNWGCPGRAGQAPPDP